MSVIKAVEQNLKEFQFVKDNNVQNSHRNIEKLQNQSQKII